MTLVTLLFFWTRRLTADTPWRLAANFGIGCASLLGGDLETSQRAFDRVLASSDTHLSQREMAREPGISFNTIESYVKAAYVKLYAASGWEASQIARNLRLTREQVAVAQP